MARTGVLGVWVVATMLFAGAAGAADWSPRIAVTQHQGVFNGQAVSYTATVAEAAVTDPQGHAVGTAVTIAYVRDGVAQPDRRPVIFAFNGGPGASSSPLHMAALGPVLRVAAGPGDRSGAAGYRPNPDSPLDAADLVFIDPMGTGFARSFEGAEARAIYSVSGDARAIREVIAAWLKANHREASPRYLVGESYGTTRAAAIAAMPGLRFDGVALVALVGATPGNEMPYVTALPTMAAGAWRHGRIDRRGRTVAQVFDEAVEFARTDYVSALIRGGGLPPAERRRVAARMSQLIGLPADFIAAKNLRVSKNDWMFNILKDRGLRTGLLDVTVTAPLEPGQDGAIDDPALGVVPKRAAGQPAAPPPSPAQLGPVPSPAVGRYLTDELKFPAGDTPYYGVNFAVNALWNYERRENVFEGLAAAMRADPKLRLFWAAGYYDLTTPAYSGRYTLDQAGVPAAQLTATYFAGPHGVYDHPENLKAFTRAIRTFVTANTAR